MANAIVVKWVLCQQGMAHCQIADGGSGLSVLRIVAIKKADQYGVLYLSRHSGLGVNNQNSHRGPRLDSFCAI
jgi:hypothetical protein